MNQEKSLYVTYILWAFFGLFGFHHFYLGRDRHALWFLSTMGGFYGVGWLLDFWRIPNYVNEANEEKSFLECLTNRMKLQETPKFNLDRFINQLLTGISYCLIIKLALPPTATIVPLWIRGLLECVAMATGIHMVGNLGHEKGGFWKPFFGTLMTYVILVLFNFELVYRIGNLISVVIGTLIFNHYKEHRRTYSPKPSLFIRVLMFAFLAIIFFSCILSFCHFIVIPRSDFSKTRFYYEYTYGRNYDNESNYRFDDDDFSYRFNENSGFNNDEFEKWWRELNNEIVKSPSRKARARKILNVTDKSSKSDIKKAYKSLVKKFHPDKCKGKNRQEAERKFIEIQEAYEILSGRRK